MIKVKVDEKSVLGLFSKSNNNRFKTKHNIISNMIYINDKPRFICYNEFSVNKDSYKIRTRLYTVTADNSEYIKIPKDKLAKIYVKDLVLCIDFKEISKKEYNIGGMNITIDDDVDEFYIEQITDNILNIYPNNLSEIVVLNGVSIVYKSIHCIDIFHIIDDNDYHYNGYYHGMILNDSDNGKTSFNLDNKSNIHIYRNFNYKLCIDIK